MMNAHSAARTKGICSSWSDVQSIAENEGIKICTEKNAHGVIGTINNRLDFIIE